MENIIKYVWLLHLFSSRGSCCIKIHVLIQSCSLVSFSRTPQKKATVDQVQAILLYCTQIGQNKHDAFLLLP